MSIYQVKLELTSLEKRLGDVEDENNSFSYQKILSLDEEERFPDDACNLLNAWGLSEYYVPKEYGGKLEYFDQLIILMRLVSRRDLTVAIGHGKTFLGASPVWVAGSINHKKLVADIIKRNHPVSLGLTEKEHGSDLVSNYVEAIKDGTNYILDGKKWLINNARRGRLIAVLAKTKKEKNSRSHSFILVDKEEIPKDSYHELSKIKTHGIRGADISGIEFKNTLVDSSNVIGEEGKGLEITLKSLQISRTLCCSLSMGALDSALRTTTKFALNRVLYNMPIINIAHVRETLADVYSDLLINEALSIVISRCLHVFPDKMNLYSAVAKYFVPKQTDKAIYELSRILGARHYLREEHDFGIFQKIMRDNLLVGLFDGSTLVNAQSIYNQLPSIFKKIGKYKIDKEKLSNLFNLSSKLPKFTPENLSLTCHGEDILLISIDFLSDQLTESDELSVLVNKLISERCEIKKLFDDTKELASKLSINTENLVFRYCKLITGCCLANLVFYNRDETDLKIELIKTNLIKLIDSFPGHNEKTCVDVLINNLVDDYDSNDLFSIIKWNLQ